MRKMNTTFQHKRKGSACKLLNTVACVFVLCEIPHSPIQKKKRHFPKSLYLSAYSPSLAPFYFLCRGFGKMKSGGVESGKWKVEIVRAIQTWEGKRGQRVNVQ